MNKTIHYIWLGGKKKTRTIRKCIAGWKRHMPDWEIKEWNESNVDLDKYSFCREAYDAGKYAFAADVLRFDILYSEGGLYLDTDVKVLKSFEDLARQYENFSGFEFDMVSPGIALYAEKPRNKIIGEVLEVYKNSSFTIGNKNNFKVVGAYFSEILEKYGFKYEDKFQICGDFTIFPRTFFCPTDGYGIPIAFSENTYSVHLNAGSWLPLQKRLINSFKRICYRLFGMERIQRVMKLFRKKR